MNKNLVQTSVTLAQIFLDKLQVPYSYKEDIAKHIIEFLCKWLGNKEDLNCALNDFAQHNKDCRYECYCCGACKDEIKDLLSADEPNVDDENIKEILDDIERINKYILENVKDSNIYLKNVGYYIDKTKID